MIGQFSDEVLKGLVDCRDQIEKIDDAYDAKRESLSVPFRQDLEKLLEQRQPLIDKLQWSAILDAPTAPTKKFLNGTTDTKLLRAVESFKVVTSIRDNKIYRKVVMTLRTNPFVETLSLFREVDSDNKTVDASGVVWKQGTEKSRADSLFRFFVKTPEEVLIDAFDAFEMVFQNPYVFA